jgi:ornithine cyclodeaminase/alanine dehydrogenase-like protein (mu-crystallin family)
MLEARQFEQIRIASRTFESAERLAAEWPLAVAVESAEEALRDADVVCTVTSAAQPVVLGDWLKPGAHVNAVGSCFPNVRELDGTTMARRHCSPTAASRARTRRATTSGRRRRR